MITLQRLNVVKVVSSEFEAEKLIRKGFVVIKEIENKRSSKKTGDGE